MLISIEIDEAELTFKKLEIFMQMWTREKCCDRMSLFDNDLREFLVLREQQSSNLRPKCF